VSYNPNILNDILRARSLTRSELSRRLDIPEGELQRELTRQPEPRQGLLNDIAKELALPAFVFFMSRAPSLHDVIPDFRSKNPSPSAKSRETIQSIQLAEAVQRVAVEGHVVGTKPLPNFHATKAEEVEEYALAMRVYFEITVDDQVSSRDAKAFYVLCRRKIEDKGIFVLQDSFPESDGSGFCLSHPLYPVIVINTKKQTRGRRLFTLAHELAHVLMQRSGISDPAISANHIERLCNRFARSFLVPETFLGALFKKGRPTNDPDLRDVASASRRLKISQQAAVLRLEELKLFKPGSHEKWLRLIKSLGNPDYSEKGGGLGGPPPQEKVKLAKYGFKFATAFAPLLEEGNISEINLFRSSGLKPKYQRSYFDFVRSLNSSELHDLELD
jgi:Zn-dependent peptidase ImmA (M78 family)